MNVEKYRNLIVGSGEAGKFLAWTLAKQGHRSVVVERSMIGGSCPNVACLPSKNFIDSARTASLVDPVRGLGVVAGNLTVDMAGVARRKRDMVRGLIALHLDYYRSSGAELAMGHARFVAPRTVEVASDGEPTRRIEGERVFICVGTRATIPNVPGLAAAQPLTHVEALDLDRTPEHLVIVGGGYVGLELAQAFRRLGSRVTILHRGPRLLEREDPDVSAALDSLMRDEGIEILTQAELIRVEGRSGEGVTLTAMTPEGELSLEASDLLMAVGRTPNTDRLDADLAGVELDESGYIRVDERLRTSAENVWAVGDCAGSPQFTHAGFDDFRVVMSDLQGGSRTTTGRLIPYCLFTDPELAHVGMTETEALRKNVPYRVKSLPMERVMRARTLTQTRGFLKALIGEDDLILGFTAFGPEASEAMAVVQTAMVARMPYTALRDTIFAHPTMAEGLVFLFAQ